MKLYLILVLLTLSTFTYSQQIDSLAFFQVKNDTVTFYLNDIGDIVTQSKASFYRVARLESKNFNYIGKVKDYYINNQKAYECIYVNGELNGFANRYYNNGNLKYSGRYKNSKKDSTWVFYYDNTNIEKIVEYKNDEPFIKEFHKKNGKPVFTDGNGQYSSTITFGHKQSTECNISGKVENGKIEGPWKWRGTYSAGIDNFKDGKYIGPKYYDPVLSSPVQTVSLTGFDPHEFVDIFKFSAIPDDCKQSSIKFKGIPVEFKSSDIETTVSFNSSDPKNQPLKYKKSANLNIEFNAELTASLSSIISKNQITSFWCLMQFTVSANNKAEKVNVYSNNDLISRFFTQYITNIDAFEAPRINNTVVNCKVFLNLSFDNNTLYFPEYNYGDLSFNLLNTK